MAMLFTIPVPVPATWNILYGTEHAIHGLISRECLATDGRRRAILVLVKSGWFGGSFTQNGMLGVLGPLLRWSANGRESGRVVH
jgi:hypothetical protein